MTTGEKEKGIKGWGELEMDGRQTRRREEEVGRPGRGGELIRARAQGSEPGLWGGGRPGLGGPGPGPCRPEFNSSINVRQARAVGIVGVGGLAVAVRVDVIKCGETQAAQHRTAGRLQSIYPSPAYDGSVTSTAPQPGVPQSNVCQVG